MFRKNDKQIGAQKFNRIQRYSASLLRVVFWLGALVTMALATPTNGTVQAVNNNLALSATNGNKIVVAPNNSLHSVYAENGQIKYTASADGTKWTFPLVISLGSGTTNPTIAVASKNGKVIVGVAYVDGVAKAPFYTYTVMGSGFWIQPVLVAGDSGLAATEPSMVGYGENMHLAWNGSGVTLHYAGFAADATANPILPVSEDVRVLFLGLGPGYSFALPSIAVSKTSASDNTPLVRIAYWQYCNNYGTSFPPFINVEVATRPAGQEIEWPWKSVMSYGVYLDGSASFIGNNLRLTALSMAANATTGDFYVAFSYQWRKWTNNANLSSTELYFQNAWTGNGSWQKETLLSKATQIDVTSTNGTMRRVRIAVSEVDSNGWGATWFRTAQHQGGLTWLQLPVAMGTQGRDPQALFWSRLCFEGVRATVGKWRENYIFYTAYDSNSTPNQKITLGSEEGCCLCDAT